MAAVDAARVFGALAAANVQFVVVGDPLGEDTLRVVASRHPTNLRAVGTALERLGSTLPAPGSPGTAGTREGDTRAGGPAATTGAGAGRTDEAGPVRLGDPLGTLPVTVGGVRLELLFGGPRRSLYAETLELSEPREIAGLTLPWAAAPPPMQPAPRVTSRMLARRLQSLADSIRHVVQRDDEPAPGESPREGGDAGT